MRMLMKSLLTVTAVLSLAPTAALALPPQCVDICEVSACEDTCAVFNRRTTCGAWSNTTCESGNDAPASTTASLTSSEAQQANDASQVCSEENPAAEQGITAEI